MDYKNNLGKITPDSFWSDVDPVSTSRMDYSPEKVDSPFSGRYNEEKESDRGEID